MRRHPSVDNCKNLNFQLSALPACMRLVCEITKFSAQKDGTYLMCYGVIETSITECVDPTYSGAFAWHCGGKT